MESSENPNALMDAAEKPAVVVLIGLDSTVAPQVLAALQRANYAVELVNTGADALARFRSELPSLFILNQALTNIDELDFLMELQTAPQLLDVPFLTIVGQQNVQQAPQGGVKRIRSLVVPFTDDELLDAAHCAIESGRVQTRVDVTALSRLTPVDEFLAEAQKDVLLVHQPSWHNFGRSFGVLAMISLEEIARLDCHGDTSLIVGIAEQVAELSALDATALEKISVDPQGRILLLMPALRIKRARARLRVLSQRIGRHRFKVGSQLVELTPAIGFAPFVGAWGAKHLQEQAASALGEATAHMDLEPNLYKGGESPASLHKAQFHISGWLSRLLNRHRLLGQFMLTMIVGVALPCLIYFVLDGFGIDITRFVYIGVVAMLLITVLLIWWECMLALDERDPPENPGTQYPPASAIIAAYLPNEAEILLPTIESFLRLQYPNSLQVILAYNTPKDMPFEQTLRNIARRDRRFVPVRILGSTSKAQNINVALTRAVGEFVGVFDADHQPDPDSFRRAWRWMSDGADVVQGHCLIRNGDDSWVARMVAVEYEQIYALSHPGRARLHGFGIFGGSNGYWKTSLIRQMRMQGFMLTEDVDSSMRAVIHGHKIVSDPKLVSRELAPETLQALTKQRLRWAQGWLQITLKWTVVGLRSPYLTLRQKLGLFHLLAWREAYPWVSLQIFPIIAFWAYKAGGLANLDWFYPLFFVITLFILASGPGQIPFTYWVAHPQIRKRRSWFVFYVVVSIFFYSEFKSIISRIAHLKEAMREKAWVVTSRSKPKGNKPSNVG